MADMERRLRANEDAAEREIDMSNLVSNSTNGQQGEKKGQKSEIKKPKVPGKKLTRQTLGTCRNCGYMSSQEICKACTLLDGLNKNRPKIEIEISVEDEESSTLRRKIEGITLAGG
jgi:cytoplasmic tRNA 2-thiolation protein 1